jgi:hypothetical protein
LLQSNLKEEKRMNRGSKSNNTKDKEIISYENQKCLICEIPYVTAVFVATLCGQFIICFPCAKDLKKALERINN